MRVLTQQQAAQKLGVSRWTVKRWTEQEIIPRKCYLQGVGGRKIFIAEQIDRLVGKGK